MFYNFIGFTIRYGTTPTRKWLKTFCNPHVKICTKITAYWLSFEESVQFRRKSPLKCSGRCDLKTTFR